MLLPFDFELSFLLLFELVKSFQLALSSFFILSDSFLVFQFEEYLFSLQLDPLLLNFFADFASLHLLFLILEVLVILELVGKKLILFFCLGGGMGSWGHLKVLLFVGVVTACEGRLVWLDLLWQVAVVFRFYRFDY